MAHMSKIINHDQYLIKNLMLQDTEKEIARLVFLKYIREN